MLPLDSDNTVPTPKCRLCGSDLIAPNDSEAHVIPNALGGRLKPKGILCRACNTELDDLADNALVKAFGDWPTLLDIPRDRGQNPPKRLETRGGKTVRVEPDGTVNSGMTKSIFKISAYSLSSDSSPGSSGFSGS